MGEFASKGVAGSGLGLGIAGTALGVLSSSQNGNGLLGGLFGNNSYNEKIATLMSENSLLKSENYADKNSKEVYEQTVQNDKELNDKIFQYITPLSQEVASNRERVAVIEATVSKNAEINELREKLVRSELGGQISTVDQNLRGRIDLTRSELGKQIDNVGSMAANGINLLNSAVSTINTTLSNITKQIVPASAVCPAPMPLYNSWTSPTTTTAT